MHGNKDSHHSLKGKSIQTSLKHHNRIHGTVPTLEDLLNPVEEQEVGKHQYRYPGGNDEIIKEVMEGRDEMVESVEIEEQDQEEVEEKFMVQEAMRLCKRTEKMCLAFPDADCISSLGLQHQLRLFWGYLRRTQVASLQQSTLYSYWT